MKLENIKYMSFKLSKLLIVTGMVRWSCVPFKVPDSSGSDHIFKALLKYFVKYHEMRVINRMPWGVGEYLLISLYFFTTLCFVY